MAATQTDVDTYLTNIKSYLSYYGDRLATMHQQGIKPDFSKEIKFMLLQAYVEIANGYLAQWDSTTDDNYMTVAEFEDVMDHINAICNSEYWLVLE